MSFRSADDETSTRLLDHLIELRSRLLRAVAGLLLLFVVLMPFAIGPDLALLTRLGPAILWLGALLASLRHGLD